jgi:hypothetical protein
MNRGKRAAAIAVTYDLSDSAKHGFSPWPYEAIDFTFETFANAMWSRHLQEDAAHTQIDASRHIPF